MKLYNYYKRDTRLKKIASILSIKQGTLYQHLAQIRRIFDSHNVIGLVHVIYNTIDKEIKTNTIRLTPCGSHVFKCILEGMTDKKIGEQLGMSLSGVRRHREKMLLQNDCTSITELVSKYYEHQSHMGTNPSYKGE